MLDTLVANNDINKIAEIRYSLQAGMDDLVKKKLDDEKIVMWFIRLNRSLENTARIILKKLRPNPHDIAKSGNHSAESFEQKRARDQELREFLRKTAF
jgi:hypothetical protein